MRFPRTFVVLLLTGVLAAGTGACVVEEGSGEDPTTTTGLVPQDVGEGNPTPGDPNTPDPGSTDEGGGSPDDPPADGGEINY
ncbi:MAG: hypothetical protein KY395_07925 [Actinobacteria bacterium]|nr:hypothetical protein [Actinomycetota bacterium]